MLELTEIKKRLLEKWEHCWFIMETMFFKGYDQQKRTLLDSFFKRKSMPDIVFKTDLCLAKQGCMLPMA